MTSAPDPFAAPAPGSTPTPSPAVVGYAGNAGGPPGPIRSVGTSILLAIVTLGIYTYIWTYKTHQELKEYSGSGLGGGLGLLIYFLASPATYFLIPSEINSILSREGQTSQVTVKTGFWVLLPLVGPIVWFVKVQGQLNSFWASKGAQA